VHRSEIVGREEELHAISSFVAEHAPPGAMVIEGGAGIGKTTLWRWGVERAAERGWRVLSAGPAVSEARLAFAAIGDLLDGVLDAVGPRLPPPQRNALEVALLLAEAPDRPPDERAVAVAVLGALRELARERGLLVAVDDVQWLDVPSASVLSFVARRLGDAPVALLLAQRTGDANGVPLELDRAFGDELRRVNPRPLSVGATHRLLRSRLGLTFPRPALRRVHAASRGNPLFALEIGRVLQERPDAIPTDEPLPVPHDVEQLLARRIGRLSEAGREAVLAAALNGQPNTAVVEQAATSAGLEEAVAAGVLVTDGDGLHFVHPLFAEAAMSMTPADRRRDMHLRLAALVADPEAQALHVALGTPEPAADVAVALDRAADVADRRGAAASAAALAEHAARLTPDDDLDAVAERTIAAAGWWTDAGDTRHGLALVEPLLTRLPAGPLRLAALSEKARAVEDRHAHRRLLEDAVAEAEGHPTHQAKLLFQLCYALIHALEFDAARERAHSAVGVAERAGDASMEVFALSMAGRLDVGRDGLELLRRGRDRERDTPAFDAYQSPATWLGWWLLANDELDTARRSLLEQHRRAVEADDFWSRIFLHWPLTEVECRAGDYDAARAWAEAGGELAEQGDSYPRSMFLCCRALVAAHTGDGATARAFAEESIVQARAMPSEFFTVRPRIVLAFLAVSEGRYADALHDLEGLPGLALSAPYWATYPFLGDLFEALVRLGELERAQSLLAEIDEHRLSVQRPGAAPLLARCRGLVLAASGALDAGLASLEEALRLQEARPAPLERARTLLALGETQRRARRRRDARATLHEALTSFESLGAPLWAERARKEIARIGGRGAPASGELTPSEQRIAELVAEGKTNREVAAILVVADRTVESALTQIYRKLDVRSRTELARKLTSA
jgi:DNA-binding CsgD family transcriptional regulator